MADAVLGVDFIREQHRRTNASQSLSQAYQSNGDQFPPLQFWPGSMPLHCCLCTAPALQKKRNPSRRPPLDAQVEQAVKAGQIPGAVLIVGHDGRIVHRKAYGQRSLVPAREPP